VLSFKRFQIGLSIGSSTAVLLAALAGTAGAEENIGTLSELPATEAIVNSTQPDRITGEYLKGYFSDTARIVVSPTTWDGSDWLTAALVVGAASGISLADADIKNFSHRNQNAIDDSFANIGNSIGNPLFVLPPLGLFYLYGHIYDDQIARRTALLAVESLAVSGFFTWTLKEILQRPRPATAESSTTWNGPGKKIGDYSFPSGHTTVAFSVASVLADQYDSNPYIAPIAYGLATLTGLSRIYSDKHWASDAFFGAAIGYYTGKAVVRYHAADGATALKLIPVVSQQGFGLMAEYRF
jgi:membrane-associated phospholipid phosphatase